MGNIRDIEKHLASTWDFSLLNPCFRYGIRASDLDGEYSVTENGVIFFHHGTGEVERNGNRLRIETKPKDFSFDMNKHRGQIQQFTEAALNPADTVLVLFGEPSIPEYMLHWPTPEVPYDLFDICDKANLLKRRCSVEDCREFVSSWFDWSCSNWLDWSRWTPPRGWSKFEHPNLEYSLTPDDLFELTGEPCYLTNPWSLHQTA